jgi:hypothetical protein
MGRLPAEFKDDPELNRRRSRWVEPMLIAFLVFCTAAILFMLADLAFGMFKLS